jgi:Holliday junction resolvase RusA-like endonuclease
MSNVVKFKVPGTPVGKGRPRVSTRGGKFARMYTPEKTASYENLVALAAQEAMVGRNLIDGPVDVELVILLPVPASWPKKKQAAALQGQVYPTKKPDIDNVEKAIFDAINGVVWHDDVQVCDVSKRKRYAEVPGVHVVVKPIEGALFAA